MHKFKIPMIEGFSKIVTPENSDFEYLSIASLRLRENSKFKGEFEKDEGLISILHGQGKMSIGEKVYEVKKHDMAYICKESYEIESLSEDFLAIIAWAPTPRKLPSSLIKVDDILKNPELNILFGEGDWKRRVLVMMTEKNVDAARLLAGYTWVPRGKWGNWSSWSWPPHEHGHLMEEAYIFYDIPKQGFGLQIVYEECPERSYVYVVTDGDIIAIPKGYHPNVIAPGFDASYLWIMCAKRAFKDRKYGAWSIDPKFKHLVR